MAEYVSGSTGATPRAGVRAGMPPSVSRLADHWGLVLAYGAVTIALGFVLALWPETSLVVLAVLLAIQLIVSGGMRIVAAVARSELDGGMRALLGLAGALGVLVGLLCLRAPLQTLVALGLLVGAWWVVSGVIDLVSAAVGASDRRAADAILGLVSLVAGAYLLLNPEITLPALVVVACVWLFGIGGIAVLAALQLRSMSRRQAFGR